jgi:hypothetical protein
MSRPAMLLQNVCISITRHNVEGSVRECKIKALKHCAYDDLNRCHKADISTVAESQEQF